MHRPKVETFSTGTPWASPRLPAVHATDLSRQTVEALPENMREVGGTPESTLVCDLLDRKLRRRFQQLHRLIESNIEQRLMDAFALVVLEEPVEVATANADRPRDLLDRQRSPVILAHERDRLVANTFPRPVAQFRLRWPAPDAFHLKALAEQQPVPSAKQARKHAIMPRHGMSREFSGLSSQNKSLGMV
jgi:hypothetical protein